LNEPHIKAFQFIEGGARYGAAVSIMNIAAGMRRCDVDVEFGVFAGRPLGSVLRERDFPVHEIRANRRFDTRAIGSLMKLFRARRYDIVHTHLSRATVNGSIAARLTKTPVVATVHGMNKKYTYLLANHIMTVSEAARKHLLDQGLPDSRITAVYNCITLDAFNNPPAPGDGKQAYGFGPDDIVIGTISRAHHQKGIDVAVATVAELRSRGINGKYLFIGDGPHMAEFKSLAAKLGLQDHAKFPGFSENVVRSLSAMDVFLFPTEREAFGISLLEAMAARVPIVASAVDGVPEVLDQGSGLLIQNRTPTAFADATQQLLDDPDLRQRTVANARERVETVFSVERTARAVEHVYRIAIRQADISPRRRYHDVL
jgi:glycosyltransferase involved in cell wall biosynthesis